MPRNELPDESTLRRLYEEDLQTEKQIADLYGVSQPTIGRLRKKYGISPLVKSDRTSIPKELTPRQTSILIGSMLGNGRLYSRGSKTAGYSEHHSLAQEGYLAWKLQEWGPFVSGVTEVTHHGEYPGKVMYLHASRTFYPFWETFYPSGSGNKVFRNLDPESVDPLALAVWFMDDGSKATAMYRFHVGSDPESQRVQMRILKRYEIRPTLYGSGSDATIVIQGRTYLNRFAELVGPYMEPSMAYKLQLPTKRGPAPRDVLTREVFEGYLGRGLSFHDIGKATGIARSTVSGIAKKLGLEGVSIPGLLSVEDASDMLGKLNREASDYVAQASQILLRTRYPEPIGDSEALQRSWELLLKSPTRFEGDRIVSTGPGGTKLCNHIFQYREEARYHNKTSLKSAWYQQKRIESAVRFQLRVGDPVNPERVKRALSVECRSPTNFRPCFAKVLVERFCLEGGVVLDPCAGYGGRATGTKAAGRQYIGVDPHPLAGAAYAELQKHIGEILFYNQPFEDVTLGDLKADLVLTSPPYFSVERYSEDPSQSWVRYKSWDSWVEGFLTALVVKGNSHLKSGGYLVVNTKNVKISGKVYPIADELVRLAQQSGLVQLPSLILPLGQIGSRRTEEPILVFQKA